jgi:hypothetical protein
MSAEENDAIDLAEGIKTAKILSGDDLVDFSYPEGFLSAAKSLQFLPDDGTKLQVMTGFTMSVPYL